MSFHSWSTSASLQRVESVFLVKGGFLQSNPRILCLIGNKQEIRARKQDENLGWVAIKWWSPVKPVLCTVSRGSLLTWRNETGHSGPCWAATGAPWNTFRLNNKQQIKMQVNERAGAGIVSNCFEQILDIWHHESCQCGTTLRGQLCSNEQFEQISYPCGSNHLWVNLK